jgi:hypothetical protein
VVSEKTATNFFTKRLYMMLHVKTPSRADIPCSEPQYRFTDSMMYSGLFLISL